MRLLHTTLLFLLLALPQVARLQERDWDAEAARLEMYRQHWNTHNIHRYEFRLDVKCFCILSRPSRVVVEAGRIIQVEDIETGRPYGTNQFEGDGVEVLDRWPTIDELFAEIERAIANPYGTTHPGDKTTTFAVEYDMELGYPSYFEVEYHEGISAEGRPYSQSDTDYTYRISEIETQPLPYRGAWLKTAGAPLSPRNDATIAWDGHEIFVFGGNEHYCPPMAACLARNIVLFADGAAYDPARDSWRKIADAPTDIVRGSTTTVAGDVFVLALDSLDDRVFRLLRYQPGRDRWDEFDLPETINEPGITTFGNDLLLFSRSDQYEVKSDWQLDVANGEWTRLPDDPLRPGFWRQYLAFGEDLYLFDHELTPSPGGNGVPSFLRAARLRDGQWELLPTADSIGGPPDLIAGTLLIHTTLGCANSGYGRCIPHGAAFDTASDRWHELPNAPRRGYMHVESSGGFSANDLTLGNFSELGHPALDAVTNEWFTVPALDSDLNTQRSIAPAGPFGFAFGGARPGGELMNEAWIWKP